MSRKLIITIHLTLAAFFTPILIIIATSGGLYLLGEKGEFSNEEIYRGELSGFNFESEEKESQIQTFMQTHGIKQEFEYIKSGGRFMMTRPTSKTHLLFEREKKQLVVTRRTPNFLASIVEIHKGHGPTALKTFQKVMAVGLLLILLSGVYLGLSSKLMRFKTITISAAGLVTFLLLAIV